MSTSRFATLLLAVILVACQAPAATESPAALRPVTLLLGFRPDVQFAPFYVAQQEGYSRFPVTGDGVEISCGDGGPKVIAASLIGNVMERGFGHTPMGDHAGKAAGVDIGDRPLHSARIIPERLRAHRDRPRRGRDAEEQQADEVVGDACSRHPAVPIHCQLSPRWFSQKTKLIEHRMVGDERVVLFDGNHIYDGVHYREHGCKYRNGTDNLHAPNPWMLLRMCPTRKLHQTIKARITVKTARVRA